MHSKIDILKKYNQIIAEDYSNDKKVYTDITELSGDKLNHYNDFDALVISKLGESEQIFVSNYMVTRFAKIYDFNIDNKGFEEVLYDDLSDEEKNIFDNFYNTFTE
jgi:hypothetical protein